MEKIFKNIVDVNNIKPQLRGVEYKDGNATGTDGYKLLHIVNNGSEITFKKEGIYELFSEFKKDYDKLWKNDSNKPPLEEWYRKTGEIKQEYPNCYKVLPQDYVLFKEFDLKYLNDILLTIYKNKLSNPTTGIVAFEFDTQEGKFYIGFNAELLSQLCESMIMAGQNRVNFYFSSSSRGVVLLNVNLKYPKSKNEKFFMDNNFGLIMPVLINLDKDYIEEDLKKYPLIKYNDIYDFDIRIGDSPSYNLIEGENKPNSKKQSKSELYNQLIDGYELSLEIETNKEKIKMYGDLIDGYKLALELEDEEPKYVDGGNVNDEKNEKMKKEFNKNEYNKLCADLLGWKNEKDVLIHTEGKQIRGTIYQTPFFKKEKGVTYSSGKYSIEKLKFDSDWNWIMEVVEKIKSLIETKDEGAGTRMVTKFDINNYAVVIGFENGDYYGSIYVGHTDNGKYFKYQKDVDNVKEAVVQAIWEFLNWYNEQKK